jgi:predicted dehydrogenase
MRYVVVGLGNIGGKRRSVLGDRCVATIDPFNAAADYRRPEDCPPDRYDAAVLAVPNDVKLPLLEYFLSRGKHALVEKPLILEAESADALDRHAGAGNAIWYTSYNFRFEPHVIALKRHLDAGAVGRVYRVRMFYGNGTAGSIAGTWRDSRLGILEDMASHLIDLAGFDHCILATVDRAVVIECSFLAWKNRWRIEVTGDRGAVEMDGLTKWGGSELIVRRRKLPSGVPDEMRDVIPGPDQTWAGDIRHFEELVAARKTSRDNDLWLSRTIHAAAAARLDGEP